MRESFVWVNHNTRHFGLITGYVVCCVFPSEVCMQVSGICHRCNKVATLVYARNDRSEYELGASMWMVTVQCPRCGSYQRPPFTDMAQGDDASIPPAPISKRRFL